MWAATRMNRPRLQSLHAAAGPALEMKLFELGCGMDLSGRRKFQTRQGPYFRLHLNCLCGPSASPSNEIKVAQTGIENMEKKSGFLDKSNQGNCRQMSDVALANDLVKSIGGGGRVGDFLHAAAKEMKRLFPHQGEPKKQWTERRLKSWWNNETDVVRHWQMMELYQAAEIVNDEQALLKQAKRKHAEFIEKTTRIRTLAQLANQDDARGEI